MHDVLMAPPVLQSKSKSLVQDAHVDTGESANTGTQSFSHSESVSPGEETSAASTQVNEFEPDCVLVEREQQCHVRAVRRCDTNQVARCGLTSRGDKVRRRIHPPVTQGRELIHRARVCLPFPFLFLFLFFFCFRSRYL